MRTNKMLKGNDMEYIVGVDYKFQSEFPSLDKAEVGDLVLVVYDYMAMPKEERKNNLVAYSKNGNKIWVAEGPGKSVSSYYKITSTNPLIANSFCSHKCWLNPINGKLLSMEFYK